ncbi:rhodanese-like domain-containing protein [Bremerella sp. T1]|uniref:rhodanese-like domain-containing protein n=1 Tax=Bremerella sp. TYQ1 TaxID=3119568 RepID=UPI001CCC2BBB|nr:rhodanese-like domain-containing protein [Bremerella volcania]UBM35001.1 rhodanese-like domain-containing protein [Bremerella volcania]
MRAILATSVLLCGLGFLIAGTVLQRESTAANVNEENPQIDYQGFLKQAQEVAQVREKRRISEAEFLRMLEDSETVFLDARSKAMYDLLHVKGAVHISLPDMTEEDLAKVIPDKQTKVVIYCNNNFKNEPTAFATKAPVASLNLNTYNTLYSYGYRNIYELKPLLDRKTTKIPFAGSLVEDRK